MILLTFPLSIAWQIVLSKASAKADNLISAKKTGRLLDVDIHPDFRTLMEHKALSTWCRTFMHTREKDILFLNALKISLAPTPQEGPCHVMFVGILHTEDQKELNTCELQESRYCEINVCNRRFTHSIFVVSDDDFGETVVSVLGSYDTFSQCFTPLSFHLCDHVIINTNWCCQSEQMDTRMLTSAVESYCL